MKIFIFLLCGLMAIPVLSVITPDLEARNIISRKVTKKKKKSYSFRSTYRRTTRTTRSVRPSRRSSRSSGSSSSSSSRSSKPCPT